VLKLKDREEGSVSAISVGNFMHDVFNDFINRLDSVNCDSECNNLFKDVKEKVLKKSEYLRYFSDSQTACTMDRVISECEKYCKKTYSYLKKSTFSQRKTEQEFGEGKSFPAVSIAQGKVKLCGKIDRVDENDNYFRVVDYKTGKTDSSNESLFSGTKLQLYLYAKAVQQKYVDGSKELAGLYYLPISDKYEKEEDKCDLVVDGLTLDNINAISDQGEEFVPVDKRGKLKNGMTGEELSKYVEYAVSVASTAVENMMQGVMIASPYNDACKYCEYGAFCSFNGTPRSVGKVTKDTITKAEEGGEL
jgi:ATP-dependent helicase/nuclease subunit B